MRHTTRTLTTEGLIPHLAYRGIHCPVKLDFSVPRTTDDRYPPLRRNGMLVYALPGGR
jgi:hypothetical protein